MRVTRWIWRDGEWIEQAETAQASTLPVRDTALMQIEEPWRRSDPVPPGLHVDARAGEPRDAVPRACRVTDTPEQQLCVRCGHIRSVHADGMNDCQAYHELPVRELTGGVERCDCPGFVAAFNEAPAA